MNTENKFFIRDKITLHTEIVIDSAHRLVNYQGECSRIHGHTWKVDVWIQGKIEDKDVIGILFDFGKIKIIKEKLDHRFLNDIEPFDKINPTAENLSLYILEELLEINPILEYRVKIFETAIGKETWCQMQTTEFDIKYL